MPTHPLAHRHRGAVRDHWTIARHNVPEELAMAVPAVASRPRTMLFALVFIPALAEPAGALVASPSCN